MVNLGPPVPKHLGIAALSNEKVPDFLDFFISGWCAGETKKWSHKTT